MRQKILQAILNDDWQILLGFLTKEEIKANHIETDLDEYELRCHFSEDGRYTYPHMKNLIYTVIRKLLNQEEEKKEGSMPEKEKFIEFYETKIKKLIDRVQKLRDKDYTDSDRTKWKIDFLMTQALMIQLFVDLIKSNILTTLE